MKSSIVAGWVEATLSRVAEALGCEPAAPAAPPDSQQLLGSHLRKLFSILQINCVLDVGANQGQYGLFLRRAGYNGRIVSFEPVPDDFEVLAQQAAADPDWEAYCLALGDEDCAREMHVVGADSLFNSFLAPGMYMRRWGLLADERLEVPVRRLDGLFPDLMDSLDRPRVYLKSDTQGYDLHVVEGATGVLSSIHALQVELALQPIYEGMTPYRDVLAALKKKGFDVSGFFPISLDDRLRLMEADCVLVARDAAGPLGGLHPPDWAPDGE